jgi:hypothetical protein
MFEEPHQNCCMSELILEHKVLGSMNTLMQYVGMACITAFNRISHPAWDKNLNFQSCIRFQTLSMMPLNSFVRDFPTNVGNPKYVSYLCELGILDSSRIFSRASCGVLRLKKITVFEVFNFCPDVFFGRNNNTQNSLFV